jgi:hypothetical protein
MLEHHSLCVPVGLWSATLLCVVVLVMLATPTDIIVLFANQVIFLSNRQDG